VAETQPQFSFLFTLRLPGTLGNAQHQPSTAGCVCANQGANTPAFHFGEKSMKSAEAFVQVLQRGLRPAVAANSLRAWREQNDGSYHGADARSGGD
jgi:hypothetical protein